MTTPDEKRGNQVDAPGASARREYERRTAKDNAATKAKWGVFGDVAVALTPERQSTRVWNTGAIGERQVGAALDRLAAESIRVMHDRRIPRSKANIDHIVVTAGGVWVIDTKRYLGKAPERRVEGGLFRPRVELLFVKGRDKTSLVDGVLKQKQHVSEAVGDIPVAGVLCFVDAEWPLFSDPFTVNGVQVVWPKKLATMLQRSTDPVIDVPTVAEMLERRFARA